MNWGKFIWKSFVPPSNSLLLWRLLHNKLPTDENWINRGLSIPSICNLCFKQSFSIQHLIFECFYTINIWRWLSNVLNTALIISSMDDICATMNKYCSPQCKSFVLSVAINFVSAIWFATNQVIFKNRNIH